MPKKGFRFVGVERTRVARKKLGVWILSGVVAVGLMALAWCSRFQSSPENLPPTTIPLTSYDGFEQEPAFSPDSKQIAFVWNGKEDGCFHLYLKMIGGDESLQLTNASANDHSPTCHRMGERSLSSVRFSSLESNG